MKKVKILGSERYDGKIHFEKSNGIELKSNQGVDDMTRIRGDLRDRIFDFACRILEMSTMFPNDPRGWVLAKQTIRSGTSIGANVREADNAFTDQDFADKCSVARKEAGETHYRLELSVAAKILPEQATMPLVSEADELTRILSTIVQRTQTTASETNQRNTK